MKKIIFLFLIITCFNATAQMYRMVNGNFYRTDDPSIWRVFSNLRVTKIFPDGSLQVIEVFNHTTTGTTVQFNRYGTQTSSYESYGQAFVLRNYRSNVALAPGMYIGYVKAMLAPPVTIITGERDIAARANYNGSTGNGSASAVVTGSEYDAVTYDVGTPYYPPQPTLTPEQIAARKMAADSNVVAFLKIQATNGIADEQCELGERYIKGDGVDQDNITGQMWLEKAALQGNIEASNDLQQMTLTNDFAAKK